ncbi:transposase (plasmid) [Streptomyces clavuligerus]|nr:transposase [Streptomyces clavuligerus]WDN57597.1 transposase [Streptomyces clavuligerus]
MGDGFKPPAWLGRPSAALTNLNPVEGIWSLLRRGRLSNVAFHTPEHLVQRIRRGLRHIQYRSDLIDGCLAETGLTIRST